MDRTTTKQLTISVDREFAKAYLQFRHNLAVMQDAQTRLDEHRGRYTYDQLNDKRTSAHKQEQALRGETQEKGQRYVEARDHLLSVLMGRYDQLPEEEVRKIALSDPRFDKSKY